MFSDLITLKFSCVACYVFGRTSRAGAMQTETDFENSGHKTILRNEIL